MKVLICDDHPGITESIKENLDRSGKFEFTAEANNISGALEILAKHKIDVAIVDLNLDHEDGMDLIYKLKIKSPHTRVVVFTAYKPELKGLAALKAGVYGYITKDHSLKPMADIIQSVSQGNYYFSQKMINLLAKTLYRINITETREMLNETEIKTIELMEKGVKTDQIAKKLPTGKDNVYKLQKSIRRKLQLPDNYAVIEYWRNKHSGIK